MIDLIIQRLSSIKLFLNNIQQLVVRLFQELPILYRIFHLFSPLI